MPSTSPAPSRVLTVAALGAGVAFVDATIVNVAFPDIGRDFPGVSLDTLSWVLNAYNIVFAALLLPAGRLADVLGRRRMFTIGVLLFTLASGLCAVAPTLPVLIGARVLQAVGSAILVPASMALVVQAYQRTSPARGIALWSAIAALAAGLGPSLGGLLVEVDGWRLAFLVNLPIGALVLALTRGSIPESRGTDRRLPDLVASGLMALSTASLTLGIVEGSDWGWDSPAVLGSWVAAVVLGLLVVVRGRGRGRVALIDPQLVRVRSTAVANVLTVVGAAGFYGYILVNVLFLTTMWHWSVLDAGLALTPGPIVAAAVAGPAGRVAERVGAFPVIAAGALLWAAGIAVLVTAVGTTPDLLGEWVPAMLFLGVGAGTCFPVIGGAAVADVDAARYATATGLNSIARQLGAVIGVAVVVAIIGVPTTPTAAAAAFDHAWEFAAGCFVLVALGSPGLRVRRARAAARRRGLAEA
ncbi:MFS transporter [Patulibacter minatonensis]|uniref:MFS transporter n=1 Tax=Patulibacter minatonensis TaxID=298163 RepID=UPI0004B52B29|nr:MFS transporter [Patulibacter minatonensis]